MYSLRESYYGVTDEDLFVMAKRVNKKRSFLFVSKVLGKHLPVKASDVLYHSMLLSRRLNEVFVCADDLFDWDLDKGDFVGRYLEKQYRSDRRMVFIGFAETATGLGQCVFDRFDNAVYFNTTREEIDGVESVLTFEEEHSHATSHYCYVDERILKSNDPIVLVDDEVTTGKTSLNIIKDIQRKFPRDEYVVVSYLNWMDDNEREEYRKYEIEQGVKIHFVYLMSGSIDRTYVEELKESGVTNVPRLDIDKNIQVYGDVFGEFNGYVRETGRFGITDQEQRDLKNRLKMSTKKRDGKVLVIGDGELMYLPIMMAYYMGDQYMKTTTRSPIHVEDVDGYLIRDGIRFGSVDGKDVEMHLYNIKDDFDQTIIVLENKIDSYRLVDLVTHLNRHSGYGKIDVLKLSWGDIV